VIEVEGDKRGGYFAPFHGHHEEVVDRGPHDEPLAGEDNVDGETKQKNSFKN
jgi:hypothetical protein